MRELVYNIMIIILVVTVFGLAMILVFRSEVNGDYEEIAAEDIIAIYMPFGSYSDDELKLHNPPALQAEGTYKIIYNKNGTQTTYDRSSIYFTVIFDGNVGVQIQQRHDQSYFLAWKVNLDTWKEFTIHLPEINTN